MPRPSSQPITASPLGASGEVQRSHEGLVAHPLELTRPTAGSSSPDITIAMFHSPISGARASFRLLDSCHAFTPFASPVETGLAASTHRLDMSHVAVASVRREPTLMLLGEAVGAVLS